MERRGAWQWSISTDDLTTSEMWYEFDLGSATLNDGVSYFIRVDNSSLVGKVYLGTDSSGDYAGGDLINKDGNAELGKTQPFECRK